MKKNTTVSPHVCTEYTRAPYLFLRNKFPANIPYRFGSHGFFFFKGRFDGFLSGADNVFAVDF